MSAGMLRYCILYCKFGDDVKATQKQLKIEEIEKEFKDLMGAKETGNTLNEI